MRKIVKCSLEHFPGRQCMIYHIFSKTLQTQTLSTQTAKEQPVVNLFACRKINRIHNNIYVYCWTHHNIHNIINIVFYKTWFIYFIYMNIYWKSLCAQYSILCYDLLRRIRIPEFSLVGWSAAEVVSRPKDKFFGTIKKINN